MTPPTDDEPSGRAAQGRRDAPGPWGPDAPAGPAGAEPRLLDPRARTMWWALAAAAVVVAAPVLVVLDRVLPVGLPPGWLAGPGLLIAVVAAAVVPAVRYRRWRYSLRDRDLWIRRGVVWVAISVIPYRRLQFVDTRQGPVARLFGLAELVVHTAAIGTSGRVPGLRREEAEQLRERLGALEPDDAPV